MTTDKSDTAKADVIQLFVDCNAKLIQMDLFYKNPEDLDTNDVSVLALTDSMGLENIARELNVKEEIKKSRVYSFFNLDSAYLKLCPFSSTKPIYGIVGFEVERKGYQLKVAAFKK